eukprot:Skav213780  [mRNA]  locus=scaffold3228:215977:219958:- [translate_table: standard]
MSDASPAAKSCRPSSNSLGNPSAPVSCLALDVVSHNFGTVASFVEFRTGPWLSHLVQEIPAGIERRALSAQRQVMIQDAQVALVLNTQLHPWLLAPLGAFVDFSGATQVASILEFHSWKSHFSCLLKTLLATLQFISCIHSTQIFCCDLQ